MPNMQQKINLHNQKIKNTETAETRRKCNCSGQMGPCPMNGNCLVKSVVYKAEVCDENQNTETYTGLTSRTFKDRFYNHRSSFNHEDSEHSTTLSTHIWKLKNDGTNFNIKWEVLAKARAFNPNTRKCSLCIKEKFLIMFNPSGASLNQRSEFLPLAGIGSKNY